MDISLAYDTRTTSSGPFTTRNVLAPQYMLNQQYNGSTTLIATQQQVQQNNPFSFAGYTGAHSVVPAFTGYIQQRPLPPLGQTASDERSVQYNRNGRQGFVEAQLSQSPPIKPEPHWNLTPTSNSSSPTVPLGGSKVIKPAVPVNGAQVVDFCTEVDTLMKAIQAQTEPSNPPSPTPVVGASFTPPHTHSDSHNSGYSSGESSSYLLTDGNCQDDTSTTRKVSKKRYPCTVGNCNRNFYQKTHLDIHVRSHTGERPYNCKHAGCDRSFSQLGNLKTHERRHTGERPYACELCGKRFAQRGNVRQHKTIHGQAKPYPCKLDDGSGKECGKLFTQLGNLKSHQNKFHVVALRNLTTKFASFKNGDNVSAADKELHEYFRELYKNSNKGIKGRGKQRKVGPDSVVLSSGMNNLALDHSYSLSGSGRGNMVMNVMHDRLPPVHLQGRIDHGRYEICEVDDGSQSGHSGSGSGSGYDDVHSDSYDNNSPNSDLAFGDRIY